MVIEGAQEGKITTFWATQGTTRHRATAVIPVIATRAKTVITETDSGGNQRAVDRKSSLDPK